MQKNKFNLGGEQSGHIILGKFATTGDGLLVSFRNFIFFKKRKKASELFNNFKPNSTNFRKCIVKDKNIIDSLKCKKAIKVANRLIKKKEEC